MTPAELRAWIDRHGYTVTGLARELGYERNTVQLWLMGRRQSPRLLRLALDGLERRNLQEDRGGGGD